MGVPFAISVAQTLEVKAFTSMPPQVAINVFHFRTGALTPPMTSQDVLHGIDTLLSALYAAVLPLAAYFSGWSIKDVTPGGSIGPQDFLKSTIGYGTVTGDNLPTQVALVVTKQTASAGRGYRGRLYVPFPTEVCNDSSGNPTSGYQGQVNTLATAMFTPFSIIPGANRVDLVPVIRHRITGASTNIIAWRTNRLWGTQRRRGDYGRPNVLPPELV